MPCASTLPHVNSAGGPCIPPHCTCVSLPMVVQVEISLCSKAAPLVCKWQQAQQLGKCVWENGSRVPLPHCMRSLYIPPFMEGRSPDNSYASSSPKLVQGFLFLHLVPTPTTSLHVYLISNSTVSLLWLSMQNYLGLGCGHSCPCHAHKRKRMKEAGLKQNTTNLIEWV